MNLVYRTAKNIRIPGLIYEIMPWVKTVDDILDADGDDIVEAINDCTGELGDIPLLIMTSMSGESIVITCNQREKIFRGINRTENQEKKYSLHQKVNDVVKDFFKEVINYEPCGSLQEDDTLCIGEETS